MFVENALFSVLRKVNRIELSCAFVEKALFLHRSLIVKSQQKRIELVTRPVHDQTPHLRENEACPVGDLVAEDVLELLVRAESEFGEHRPSGGEESHQLLLKSQHFVFHGPKVALKITAI